MLSLPPMLKADSLNRIAGEMETDRRQVRFSAAAKSRHKPRRRQARFPGSRKNKSSERETIAGEPAMVEFCNVTPGVGASCWHKPNPIPGNEGVAHPQ
jgi:hypothetical protein